MQKLTIRRPDDWHLHLRDGAALNAWDQSTFYGGGAKGYTDYPALA